VLGACGSGVESTADDVEPPTVSVTVEDPGDTTTTTEDTVDFGDDTTETTADDSGGEPSDNVGGSSAVDQYCDAIDEFRDRQDEVVANPTAENSQWLSDLGQELADL